jgi:hypothetical protein
LNTSLSEQAERDNKRIEFRQKLFQDKMAQMKAEKERKQHEQELKDKRLEKFYDSVKPHVEADPIRMISYTEVLNLIFFNVFKFIFSILLLFKGRI